VKRGSIVRIVVAFGVLGAIYADLANNHCGVPRAVGSGAAVGTTVYHSASDDPCSAGCVPDCFSCSRSEEPTLTSLAFAPRIIVAAFVGPEARANDGIPPLPYHPPL
jgi:hypothetical protein